MKNDRTRVLLALGSLYVIWGSTFLAIRIALQGYPPLMLAGLRFVIAGAVTYAFVRGRRGRGGERGEVGAGREGEPPPAAAEGADGEGGADAGRRNGAAPLRRAPRRARLCRADRAGDAGARVSDRGGLDRRIQRLPVSALARSPHAGGELRLCEPRRGGWTRRRRLRGEGRGPRDRAARAASPG